MVRVVVVWWLVVLLGWVGRMGLVGVVVGWLGRGGGCWSVCVGILGWMWVMLGFLCFLGRCLRIVLLLLVVGVRSSWMVWVRWLRVAPRGMLCVGVLVVVWVGLCLCFLGRVRSGLGWQRGCWIAPQCLLSG